MLPAPAEIEKLGEFENPSAPALMVRVTAPAAPFKVTDRFVGIVNPLVTVPTVNTVPPVVFVITIAPEPTEVVIALVLMLSAVNVLAVMVVVPSPKVPAVNVNAPVIVTLLVMVVVADGAFTVSAVMVLPFPAKFAVARVVRVRPVNVPEAPRVTAP